MHGNTAIPPSLSHTSIQIASIVTKVTDFLIISLLRTFFYCSRFVFKMNRTRIADFCSMLYLARNGNLQCKNLYCAFHLANCAILSHFAKQTLELFQTLPLTRNRAIETYLIKAESPQRGMPPQQVSPEQKAHHAKQPAHQPRHPKTFQDAMKPQNAGTAFKFAAEQIQRAQ